MQFLSTADFIALGVFILAWSSYTWLTYYSPLRKNCLSKIMDDYRHEWMMAMLDRDVRIADTNIAAGLQQGTAFFASASLIALGGAFSFLNSTEQIVEFAQEFPLTSSADPTQWRIKGIGLILILAYAFFKFGWAYRLFNYATIVIGSIPDAWKSDNEDAVQTAKRAARLTTLAGRHFSRGQQSLFFAIGFLGWYAGPEALITTTLFVLAVLLRRQFASKARDAVLL